jgi:hypothetical protein
MTAELVAEQLGLTAAELVDGTERPRPSALAHAIRVCLDSGFTQDVIDDTLEDQRLVGLDLNALEWIDQFRAHAALLRGPGSSHDRLKAIRSETPSEPPPTTASSHGPKTARSRRRTG